jgi:FKBP-type peptidyl-prolyl cis-trans isomerase (trigger factor)
MEIAERPAEGLQRRFRLVLPPGPIAAECARRAAELAVGLDQNGAVPEAQRSAMLSRSDAAINADILGKAIEAAIGGILRDAGIRPAARPTITLEPRGLDGAYIVTINVEALPEVSVPVLGEVVLDRTVAAPDEDEIEAAVQALRRRHGVWHELVDAGADIADEITCDIRGWAEPDPLAAAPAPHPALRAERFASRGVSARRVSFRASMLSCSGCDPARCVGSASPGRFGARHCRTNSRVAHWCSKRGRMGFAD